MVGPAIAATKATAASAHVFRISATGTFEGTQTGDQVRADGGVTLSNTVTMGVTSMGFTVTIPPQEWSESVSYINAPAMVEASIGLTGITDHGTGLCGPASYTEGTFDGSSLIFRAGSGTIQRM
jgi:hypothetical protein